MHMVLFNISVVLIRRGIKPKNKLGGTEILGIFVSGIMYFSMEKIIYPSG